MRIGLIFLTVAVLLPSVSLASEYVVVPRVIEHTIAPRDMIEESVKVTNTGLVPIRIYPTVNAITLGEDGQIKEFTGPATSDQSSDISTWLSVSRARLELAPGETKRIPIGIKISPKAVPGDYFAFIGFAEGDNRDDAEARVAKGNAPGVTLNLTLADTTNEYLRLNKFIVDRFVSTAKDSQLTYELENIGDIAVTPGGEILLYNVRGEEVAALAINNEQASIDPGQTSTFSALVPDTGAYGRHKAFLSLEYGSKQRSNLYDTTFYTVVPIPLLAGIFTLLLVISTILALMYHRRQQASRQPEDESVSLYVRSGVHTELQHHDINLKQD